MNRTGLKLRDLLLMVGDHELFNADDLDEVWDMAQAMRTFPRLLNRYVQFMVDGPPDNRRIMVFVENEQGLISKPMFHLYPSDWNEAAS